MFKFNNIFKNGTKISKESSPHIQMTDKSLEGLNRNRNISLDFSNTPMKQGKKIIKRNSRTNSFNSLLINQTESGIYSQYSNMAFINPSLNNRFMANKNMPGLKYNYYNKNKSINLKKGIFNLNKPKLPLRKKNTKKKNGTNFLNSYFINPSNIHISFNTVGNNIQIEPNSKPNKNSSIKTEIYHKYNLNNSNNNNKYITSETNKNNIKSKNTKKFNFNNEINNIIHSTTEEQQKIILDEIKLFLNLYLKIKKNKNEIAMNEKDLTELQKGGVFGHALYENYNLKKKNEELEKKIENISKELDQIKIDKREIKKEIEKRDLIIKNMNDKMNALNKKFKKLQNEVVNNKSKKNIFENRKKNKDMAISHKSSQNDIENISLGNNLNINIENYKTGLNKSSNLKKNKSEKNIKTKNKVANLNFNSKVGSFNFNDEFLKDYENFSESWRKEVDKMLKRRGNKKISEN